MINLLEESQRLLEGVDISTSFVKTARGAALAFEGLNVLGFIFAYPDPAHLLDEWNSDANTAISEHQLNLRRAQIKAWNTYTVFLSGAAGDIGEQVAVNAIEEDLKGTRKIARVGIGDVAELRSALLPLLPIQNHPRLKAVDMPAEIRLRTTELPHRAVEAFLSGVQETSIAQVLEEEP